ncbi:N-acetylmuramoyl-L-alanine amidase [Nitrospirillum viridazoti Y2]|nr:N-acetylmuramoyl-L-alanine amidase [Nitrospirillum amazonense Y2]
MALTRDSDVFIPLRERPGKARALGADLFISLHADIVVGRPVRGLSVYTLSDKATDREADMLAQRENRSDAIVGMDLADQSAQVASILIDLAQRDTRNQSRRLANLVVESVGRDITLLNSPLRSAGFAVLTAPDVPAILVEMGYLSHPTDARLLASDSHRRRFAADLVRAIDGYFGPRRSPSRK